MAAELAVHPSTPQTLVSNNAYPLYFNNNPNRMHSLSSEAILLERIGGEFVVYQKMVAGTEITDNFDVPNWFHIQKMQFLMLSHIAHIINSINPLQTENERYFLLEGIYIASRRANLSGEMIYDFLFIDRNSAALGRNTTIDVFGGSLDAVDDIVDEIKSNPYAFAGASDTE